MYPVCRHVMTSGKKCESPALKGTPFCYFHTKFHRRARQPVGSMDSIDIPVIEDRFDIKLAIDQIVRALVNNTIDQRRAALLLSALRIASFNLDRGRPPLSSTIAKVVGPSSDGEEMAFDCDSVDDCDDCPFRDTCEDYVPLEEDGEDGEEDGDPGDDEEDEDAGDEDGEEDDGSGDDNKGPETQSAPSTAVSAREPGPPVSAR